MAGIIFEIAKKYYSESKILYISDKNISFEYYVTAINYYKDIIKISSKANEEYNTIWIKDIDLILELAQDYISKGDVLYSSKKYEAQKYYDKVIEFYQEGIKVNINELENSKEYYNKLTSFSLYYAKHFYKIGLYTNASILYEQFFNYKKYEQIDFNIIRDQLNIYRILGDEKLIENKINKIIYNPNVSSNIKVEAYYQRAIINYSLAKSNEALD